ncbi:hypothetical protein CENSYa_1318 [Cenarchaeum symbiosum A]|uniref:Uncharacterized protein n=1 Tax=Cenarchaeum symbiosum (strain A) TaxID=414004 RepID=A0RX74_CENSY|nr:hypothetical protein CENSYa_1318 [Cenarchaeum symbiosum A]
MVPSGASISEDGLMMYGMAEVTIKNANGDVLSSNTVHNAITDEGEAAILSLLFDRTANHAALGSPTVICISDVPFGPDDSIQEEASYVSFNHSESFAPFIPLLEVPDPLFTQTSASSKVRVDILVPLGSSFTVTTHPVQDAQNVTFGGATFTSGSDTYSAGDSFLYLVNTTDNRPALTLGLHEGPETIVTFEVITGEVETILAPGVQNVTIDLNNNGVIEAGEFQFIFVQPGGPRYPCSSSFNVTAPVIPVFDPANPNPVIVAPPIVNITSGRGNMSIAEIFTTFSADRNVAVGSQLNSMLICSQHPANNPGLFKDCSSAGRASDFAIMTAASRGEDTNVLGNQTGYLFSVIMLGGSTVGEGDIIEATYTFDITSPGT